ncbi:MAG TPA: complex I NDUFA9 subunit family protein [Bdellovibrionota bacterium]|nr:complex I NDUFA9 subunit family protein [Bdellovibrionota bacterium]
MSDVTGEAGTVTLVTGGTGFVGSAVVRRLIEGRNMVQVLTRDPFQVPRNRRVAGAYYLKGDIFDPPSLDEGMKGCWAVINATQFDNAPFENPRRGLTYDRIDGEGTERQVEAAKKAGVKRFIYLSGAGTREGRTETWFRAKLRAEKAVRESGLQWTILRPSWIYGPEDRSLNRFALFARIAPVIPIIGSGREKIQPVYVKDIAEIVARALYLPSTHHQTYDVGGPEAMTMKKIVQTMLRVQGKHRLVLPHPKILMKMIATFLQFLPTPPLTPGGIDFVTMEEQVDNTSLLGAIPLRLTPLEEGLRDYLAQFQGSSPPADQRVAA